jgi:hypothetical protein
MQSAIFDSHGNALHFKNSIHLHICCKFMAKAWSKLVYSVQKLKHELPEDQQGKSCFALPFLLSNLQYARGHNIQTKTKLIYAWYYKAPS